MNQLEITDDQNSPYATFLSTLTNTHPAVPSIFNELSKHWSILTSRRVEISTSFAFYFNRFIVHLNTIPKPTSSLESSNLNEGFISDIIFGRVIFVEIHFQFEANKFDVIYDFFSHLYDHSSTLFQYVQLNETNHLPLSCQIEFNCTIIEREKPQKQFSNLTLITLFQKFEQLKQEIQTQPLKTSIPIAVQVRSPFHLDAPIPFSFTHIVSNQLPPVSILLLVSNILITGSFLGKKIQQIIFFLEFELMD